MTPTRCGLRPVFRPVCYANQPPHPVKSLIVRLKGEKTLHHVPPENSIRGGVGNVRRNPRNLPRCLPYFACSLL